MRRASIVLALLLLAPLAAATDLVPSVCVERDVGPGNASACTPRVTDCPSVAVGDGGFVRFCLADGDADDDGWTVDEGDCDDADDATYPGAPEQADGMDNDCDGDVDEGVGDFDGDGHALPFDCDDNDPSRFPGAFETLNRRDDDCNGIADDENGDGNDLDADGVTLAGGDCDDTDGQVSPGAPELNDRRDNDCNGLAEV